MPNLEGSDNGRPHGNALERVSDGVVTLDQDLVCRYVNEPAARALDGDPESLAGESLCEVLPDSRGIGAQDAIERAVETDRMTSLKWDNRNGGPFELRVYPDDTGASIFFIDQSNSTERLYELEQADTLFQNAQDGLFIIDVEDGGDTFRVNRVNRAYEEYTGVSAGEVRGKTVRELTEEPDTASIREKYESCVSSREEREYEEELSVFDDASWWETRITPVIVGDDVVQIVGSTRDITGRKEREDRLRKFEQMVEHAGHVVFFMDTDGRIQYVNPAFEELTGYTETEAIGRTPDLLDSGEHDDAFFADIWETGLAGDVWSGEVVNERKDGVQFVSKHTIAPVTDGSGAVTNFVAMYHDITEQKQREKELRQKTRALDEAPVGITITDPSREDNPMTYVNEAFTDLTGYAEDESIGRNCRFLQGEGTDPKQLANLREGIAKAEPVDATLQNYRKDGTEFWNQLSIAPVRDGDGSLESFVGFQKDITERKEREKRLQTHELVIQAMNEAALLVDDQKRVRFANQAALDMADGSLDRIRGAPIRPAMESIAAPNEDPQRFIDAVDAVLLDEELDDGERVRESDGSETLSLEFDLSLGSAGDVCTEQRFVPVELYDGGRGVAVVSRDVTARREQEAKIQTHLRQAQEIGTVGSWRLDLETGDLQLSDECYRILDLEPGTPMSYDQFLELVHPKDREKVDEALDDALRDGSGGVEHRILVDGETRWMQQTAEITFDADGESAKGIGVIQDITEQRERERKMIERKRRYESLFNSIHDPIVVTDTDGRVTNANPGFMNVFGRELDDIRGEKFGLLSSVTDDCEDLVLDDENAVLSSDKVTIDYRKQSGQEFPAESTISRFRDHNGDVIGFINHIRDISEREENRQQLQVLDRVLRHNIKNDMNAIMGHAEVIRGEGSNAIQPYVSKIAEVSHKFVETAEKQQRITTLLTDPPESSVRDIVPMVKSAVSEVRDHYPDTTVEANFHGECRANVIHEFGEAVHELILNAVIHSDKEHPTVEVAIQTTDGVARIDIIDDGPGIPEPEWGVISKEREIEPLFHGSGLGLWFVHQVVRQSDGRLSFEENSTEGSSVTVRLPIE